MRLSSSSSASCDSLSPMPEGVEGAQACTEALSVNASSRPVVTLRRAVRLSVEVVEVRLKFLAAGRSRLRQRKSGRHQAIPERSTASSRFPGLNFETGVEAHFF